MSWVAAGAAGATLLSSALKKSPKNEPRDPRLPPTIVDPFSQAGMTGDQRGAALNPILQALLGKIGGGLGVSNIPWASNPNPMGNEAALGGNTYENPYMFGKSGLMRSEEMRPKMEAALGRADSGKFGWLDPMRSQANQDAVRRQLEQLNRTSGRANENAAFNRPEAPGGSWGGTAPGMLAGGMAPKPLLTDGNPNPPTGAGVDPMILEIIKEKMAEAQAPLSRATTAPARMG